MLFQLLAKFLPQGGAKNHLTPARRKLAGRHIAERRESLLETKAQVGQNPENPGFYLALKVRHIYMNIRHLGHAFFPP